MFKIFKKREKLTTTPVIADLHSHLLPDLDDGVESFEEALEIITALKNMGYEKVITTPHIMHDFYNNTAEEIVDKASQLKKLLVEKEIDLQLEAAAEYYLDDRLMEQVSDENFEFLTFGDNYLLFETSFMNQPFYLNDFIFKAKSRGLNPILAHPERYAYMQSNPDLADDLIMRGVYLQLNINSISGYYSKPVRKLAERLIDGSKIHFIGSDCHNKNHLNVLQSTRKEKYYKKALALPLLNNSL